MDSVKNRKSLKIEEFPELLKEIPSPPEEIYLIGEFPSENSLFLAVVGTRKFSNYGKEACERIIGGLARQSEKEIVIVSGLALGIDSFAHMSALKNNLKTIAVPGSGLDDKVLHPRSNLKLSKEIVHSGGCLLSEFPWDMPAAVHTFPRRNRIIAGLSQAVLVIEAPEKSGALITARLAIDFNRDVFAVPGSIFSENSKGVNRLIKMGAAPVVSGEDILEAFGIEISLPHLQAGERNMRFNFSPVEEMIFSAITEPISKDDLIRKVAMPAEKINPILTMMEISGIIKETNGEIYRAIS